MIRAPSEIFTPKLATVLTEGYGPAQFRADLFAGLTVAVVALPLSMAIAVASGADPARGLASAIVGGFLVSAFGGSRFQIGGPAGAFIVLVAATISRHGVQGLVLATFLAGLMLIAAGRLRLGTFIKYVPWPVTVGFTAGIGLIILASQLSAALGLFPMGGEPGPLAEKLPALWAALPGLSPGAAGLAAGVTALIFVLRRYAPRLPGMLIAAALATWAASAFDLDVVTIRDRFGDLPHVLPWPALPALDAGLVWRVLPDAFAFLGAIESLLSAVVADGMTGRRHRANAELVAQGLANIGASLFGGFVVTGTVARTATNVRAGAHGPVSGMIHAAALVLFMATLAPWLGMVPLAALAGVLILVAWNMLDLSSIGIIARTSRGELLVLAVTLGLTLFAGLTEAIIAGFALSSGLYVHRMGRVAALESGLAPPEEEEEETEPAGTPQEGGIIVHRLKGAFFFGAIGVLDTALARIGESPGAMVLDCSEIAFLDASAANALALFAQRGAGHGIQVYLAGADARTRATLARHGLSGGSITEMPDAAAAVRHWRGRTS